MKGGKGPEEPLTRSARGLLAQTAAACSAIALCHRCCFWCWSSRCLLPKPTLQEHPSCRAPQTPSRARCLCRGVCGWVVGRFSALIAVSPSLPFFLETSSLTTFCWMNTVSARCFVVVPTGKGRVRNRMSSPKFRCLPLAWSRAGSSPQLRSDQDRPFRLRLLSSAFGAAAPCPLGARGTPCCCGVSGCLGV